MNKERSVFLTNRKCEWKTKKVWLNWAQSWKYNLVEKNWQWIPLLEWFSPFVTFFLAWSKKESKGQKEKTPFLSQKLQFFPSFIAFLFLCSFYEVCNQLFSSFLQRSINEKYNCSSKYNFQLFGSMHILLIVSFFFFAGRRDIVLCVGLQVRAGTGQGPSP